MKLKKIASLALAGVMAVSMLAGCAGKTGTTENEGTTVTVTVAAAAAQAFNDAQATVKFTTDTTLQNALELAIKSNGTGTTADAGYLEAMIVRATGESYKAIKAGNTENTTELFVVDPIESTNAWTQEIALEKVADAVKAEVADYKDTTLAKNQVSDSKYYDYTYTGNVAMVTVTAPDGTVTYYVAYTITQNVTEQTYGI